MDRRQVLSLYRQIIRNASRFPSIKRASLVDNIKQEFRDNRQEKDPEKISKQISAARDGLNKLKMYVDSATGRGSWKVDLS